MKEKSKTLSSIRRFICTSLALVMALSLLSPITAEAKTKNVKVKNVGYTSSVSTVKKKASKVTIGTTKLTLTKAKNRGQGYIKFTAPKSKKYTFTFSELNDSKDPYSNGHITGYQIKSGYNGRQYITSINLRGKGGTRSNLWISHKKSKDYPTNIDKGSLKMKAGETVYLNCSFLGYGKGIITTKLVIK
jgi:hypothetical protein